MVLLKLVMPDIAAETVAVIITAVDCPIVRMVPSLFQDMVM